MSAILEYLAGKLASGRLTIGQVVCTGDFVLNHIDDEGRDDLRVFSDPEEAAEIARFDDNANFRPLKAAPNLRTGWQLRLPSLSATRLAIDLLYPAALGNALALERGHSIATNLCDALGRQTGMYAVTKKITDEEATGLISETCDSPLCGNAILWNVNPSLPTPLTIAAVDTSSNVIPLLCTEACPLLVAAARNVVKSRQK